MSPPAALAWTRTGDAAGLEAGLRRQVLSSLVSDAWPVRNAEAFQALERQIRSRLVAAGAQVMEVLDETIRRWHETARRVETGTYTPELDRYRWLIEEYRIQVFAQQLGTAEKVSKKRLEAAWAAVEET